MNEHGVAVDGMIYHDSQVTKDEHGRRFPKHGAQAGYILRGDEFGQMPALTEEARVYLDAWQAERGDGAQGDAEELTPATPTHVATYGTKVVTPEPPEPGILTKDDAGSRDADAASPAPSSGAPRSRPGGR
ncbi:MAG: hypothetical protein RL139_1514 [Gemmatimonadota bacterium]|jgi:hypothetical protein